VGGARLRIKISHGYAGIAAVERQFTSRPDETQV
jgi:hypothetical protein